MQSGLNQYLQQEWVYIKIGLGITKGMLKILCGCTHQQGWRNLSVIDKW